MWIMKHLSINYNRKKLIVQAKLYPKCHYEYLRQAELMVHIILSYKNDSLHVRFCNVSKNKPNYIEYVKASYDNLPVSVINETSSLTDIRWFT